MAKKLTHKEFVTKAVPALRNGKYKGIHCTYSGFNEAFREYFDDASPVDAIKALVESGDVVTRPSRGGVTIYLPQDAPQTRVAVDALAKMGLKS